MSTAELEAGRRVSVASLVVPVGASSRVSVDFNGLANAPATWGAVAVEYHGDAAFRETLSGMQITPVLGGNGETHVLPVLTPSMPLVGVFPLMIVSISRAGSLHLWVGTIERR